MIWSGTIAKVVANAWQNQRLLCSAHLSWIPAIRSSCLAPAFVLGNVLAVWFQEAYHYLSDLEHSVLTFFSGFDDGQ
jgi:hypothetical protein